jgi:protein-disulfide isomerase
MAKKRYSNRKKQQKQTNWLLIGGVIAIGVIGLFALIILNQQGAGATSVTLADYCENNPENCAFTGNADAAVTIVEVSDFGCSHCRDYHAETLPALQATYIETQQVNYMAVPFALDGSRIPAANAAMCAGEQDS